MGGGGRLYPSIDDIYSVLDTFAPFSAAEEWDNSGLLLGDPCAQIDRILISLDLTSGVIRECTEKQIGLLITHHPIFFRGTKDLREDNSQNKNICSLIRLKAGMIAAHTCLDRAPRGVAQALSDTIGLVHSEPLFDGFGRIGEAQQPDMFIENCMTALSSKAKVYLKEGKPIERCAVCPGSGGSYWKDALNAGADCLLTGEIGYHDALDAVQSGMTVIAAGHRETELPVLKTIGKLISDTAKQNEWDLELFISSDEPYTTL